MSLAQVPRAHPHARDLLRSSLADMKARIEEKRRHREEVEEGRSADGDRPVTRGGGEGSAANGAFDAVALATPQVTQLHLLNWRFYPKWHMLLLFARFRSENGAFVRNGMPRTSKRWLWMPVLPFMLAKSALAPRLMSSSVCSSCARCFPHVTASGTSHGRSSRFERRCPSLCYPALRDCSAGSSCT